MVLCVQAASLLVLTRAVWRIEMGETTELQFLEPVEEVRPMNEAGEFLGTITQFADGHLGIELRLSKEDRAVSLLKNILSNFQATGKMYKDSEEDK